MDPIEKTPTSYADYATLSAGYGALLGALLVASRDRGDEPVRTTEMIEIGVATFTLSKLLAKEKVESWVREPFVEETAEGDRRPKGRGLRYAVGELLTCTRCLGAWSALGLVALRVTRPREARVVTTVLGASAINDWMQSGFSLLCAEGNKAAKAERGEYPLHPDAAEDEIRFSR
jgi:hypothetical protein